MKLFERFKTGPRSGASLEICLGQDSYRQGAQISGEIKLHTGGAGCRIQKAFVDLVVKKHEGAEGEKGRHGQKETLHCWEFNGHGEEINRHTLTFQFSLPVNIPVSYEHCLILLQASAQRPHLPDLTSTRQITVLPSPAVTAVQETLAWRLGFWGSGLVNSGKEQVFIFSPGPGVPAEFKKIEQIEMIFAHEKTTLRIQLKARVDLLLWLDSDNYFNLELPYQEMFYPNGAANYDYLVAQLSSRLQESLKPAGGGNYTNNKCNNDWTDG